MYFERISKGQLTFILSVKQLCGPIVLEVLVDLHKVHGWIQLQVMGINLSNVKWTLTFLVTLLTPRICLINISLELGPFNHLSGWNLLLSLSWHCGAPRCLTALHACSCRKKLWAKLNRLRGWNWKLRNVYHKARDSTMRRRSSSRQSMQRYTFVLITYYWSSVIPEPVLLERVVQSLNLEHTDCHLFLLVVFYLQMFLWILWTIRKKDVCSRFWKLCSLAFLLICFVTWYAFTLFLVWWSAQYRACYEYYSHNFVCQLVLLSWRMISSCFFCLSIYWCCLVKGG